VIRLLWRDGGRQKVTGYWRSNAVDCVTSDSRIIIVVYYSDHVEEAPDKRQKAKAQIVRI